MKRNVLTLILALLLALSLLASCSNTGTPNTPGVPGGSSETGDSSNPTDDYTLRVGTLKGPTGMGMAKMISDNKTNKTKEISLFGAPEDLSAALINGSLDVAAVPVNLAAVINKRTNGGYLVAAINTLGVLYIVENGETLTSLSDLEGKTLYATGQGSTPEYMLNYILEKNNLKDKVTVEWKTEHSELATLAASGQVTYAMLPEPHVTTTLTKNSSLRAAINLTEEWDKVSEGQAVQGCLVVSKKVIDEHKSVLDAFLDEYKASVDFVNGNISEAATMIAEIGIVGAAAVAEKAIPRCNIVYIDGDAMVTSLNEFYSVLYQANPASVGGTMPSEALYYKK